MPVPSGVLTPSTGNWASLVQDAFDTTVGLYLREEPTFRAFTDKRPASQAMPGDVVTLTILGEMPLATSPLDESLDVDAVTQPAPRQLNVTLREYGNAVVNTRFLEKTAFTQTVAQDISREVALNASRSVDKLYQNVLDTGTNVLFVNNTGDAVTVAPATYGPMTTKGISTAATLLRRRNSVPRFGDLHACVIHPDVAHDLMAQTGVGTWRQPHEQVDTNGIYTRTLGDFEGCRFFTHTKCKIVAGTPDLYTTYFIDREALVEVVSEDVHTVIGPNVDKLLRFRTIGWYFLGGISVYRQNSLQLVKCLSSIEALALPADDSKA
jgi:N4-gp56 family major capsid protein